VVWCGASRYALAWRLGLLDDRLVAGRLGLLDDRSRYLVVE
jgi:hypothetical protein